MEQRDEPAITCWTDTGSKDPDEWLITVQMDLLQAGIIIGALQTAAIAYAKQGGEDVAEFLYYVSEDLVNKFDGIGGNEASLRLARKLRGEVADNE